MRLQNITRRSGSSNWYFRRAWPKEVRQIVGRAEHWVSLGTADLALARSRAAKANWEFEQRLNELRRRCAPDESEVRRVVRRFYDRDLALDHNNRTWQGSDHADFRGFFRGFFAQGITDALRESIANGQTHLVEWAADEIIAIEGWSIERGSGAYRELCHKLNRAWLEAQRRAAERDEGDYDGSPKFDLLKQTNEESRAAKPGETIMELFERFAREQQRQNASTLNQSRKIVRRFAEFVGPEQGGAAVTPENAREWKFKLQEWPVKANEVAEFRGLHFLQIIEANRFVGKPAIGQKTISKYLSALGSFGSWLKRHTYIERHPTEGLLPEKDRREKKRLPFSADQLRRLFASPLFVGCAGDRREHEPGDVLIRDDRFWLFPVALFTGARIGELCQLRVEDLREERGIVYLRITDAVEGNSLKNWHSVRDLPVHPELVRLGFLEHVNQRRSVGKARIFSRWTRNNQGQFGEASKWLNAYLGRTGVKDGREITFHSLRHNFTDALRNAGYHEAQFKPLLGHSDATVTRGYGTAPDLPIRVRAEMLSNVRYEGFDLSHLR